VSCVGAIDSVLNVCLNLKKYENAFWTGITIEKDRKSRVEAISRPCTPGTEHWQRYQVKPWMDDKRSHNLDMSALSGIVVSSDLASRFADAIEAKSTRFIKVSVQNGLSLLQKPTTYLSLLLIQNYLSMIFQ
jgi:hypothetical protein